MLTDFTKTEISDDAVTRPGKIFPSKDLESQDLFSWFSCTPLAAGVRYYFVNRTDFLSNLNGL